MRSAHAVLVQHWPGAPAAVTHKGPCAMHVVVAHTPPTHAVPGGQPRAPEQSVPALALGRHVTTGPPPNQLSPTHTPDAHDTPHPPQFVPLHESTHAPPQQTPVPPQDVPSDKPVHVVRVQKVHGTPGVQRNPLGQSPSLAQCTCVMPPSASLSTQRKPPSQVEPVGQATEQSKQFSGSLST